MSYNYLDDVYKSIQLMLNVSSELALVHFSKNSDSDNVNEIIRRLYCLLDGVPVSPNFIGNEIVSEIVFEDIP
jgi:hypothetical protein